MTNWQNIIAFTACIKRGVIWIKSVFTLETGSSWWSLQTTDDVLAMRQNWQWCRMRGTKEGLLVFWAHWRRHWRAVHQMLEHARHVPPQSLSLRQCPGRRVPCLWRRVQREIESRVGRFQLRQEMVSLPSLKTSTVAPRSTPRIQPFFSAAAEPHHSSFQAEKQLPPADAYQFDYKETQGEFIYHFFFCRARQVAIHSWIADSWAPFEMSNDA